MYVIIVVFIECSTYIKNFQNTYNVTIQRLSAETAQEN